MWSLKTVKHALFVALEHVLAAEHELGRGNDRLAVDHGKHAPVVVAREPFVHGDHQRRIAGVQHVVEDDQAVRRA